MQPDLPRAMRLADELHAALLTLPGRYQDPVGHADGVESLRRMIWAVDESSIVEDARLRAFGITSTSTGGIHSTCRNWIVRVRAMSAGVVVSV